ncbi:hypothetical protein MHU86_12943 [Fragilaria crotonensis]|nr:hypothetical protein MHU86_12943 [Fragilaria crotonensis]
MKLSIPTLSIGFVAAIAILGDTACAQNNIPPHSITTGDELERTASSASIKTSIVCLNKARARALQRALQRSFQPALQRRFRPALQRALASSSIRRSVY